MDRTHLTSCRQPSRCGDKVTCLKLANTPSARLGHPTLQPWQFSWGYGFLVIDSTARASQLVAMGIDLPLRRLEKGRFRDSA